MEEPKEKAGKTKADIEKFAAKADYCGRAGSLQDSTTSMNSMDRSIRSVRHRGVAAANPRRSVASSVAGSTKKMAQKWPVSSLKPKPPLCLSVNMSVAQVAKRMVEVRTDAVVLLGPQGDMRGILTDHDVAGKVLGQSLNPARTPVASIMSPDPTWVKTTDNALDALATMIERRFRHLPVVDGEGEVSGLLHIANCLYDAIHRLEKRALKAEEQGTSREKQELAASLLKLSAKKRRRGTSKNALAAVAQLLQGLSDVEEEPTLGDIIEEQPAGFIQVQDSASTAGKAIATVKKAVLVLNEGRLAGILTPKDLLNRVVAKGLDADTTPAEDVMTPNLDTVPPTMTAVGALKEMHENRYLHLPVVDEGTGEVLGVVGVMDIIRATVGDKGSDRWEALFGNTMGAVATSVTGSARNDKPVSIIRPKRPVVMSSDRTVLEVATEMTLKRTDAALLTKRGRVAGIVTDHDLTLRVIAMDKPPNRTFVRDVMTADPAMVTREDSTIDALGPMLQNKRRHLLVVDAQGKITGLLDIAKCLYEAINRLEKAARKEKAAWGHAGAASGTSGGEGNTMMLGAMVEAAKVMKGKRSARNQRALQEPTMLAISGGVDEGRKGINKTLGDVLLSKESAQFVRPRHTAREAASVIAAEKKAVLVVEGGDLLGIFTPKDMMSRVITKGLSPSTTAVSSVMTPNPESGDPSMTVVKALQQMCENRYHHLPVVKEESGEVMGVVDVLEIIQAIVGQKGSSGWEAVFGSVMDAAGNLSDTASQVYLRSRRATPSIPAAPSTVRRRANIRPGGEMPMSRVEIPMARAAMPTARVTRHAGGKDIASGMASLELDKGSDENIVYKVNDDAGSICLFKASAKKLESVRQVAAEKLKMPKDAILLKYEDDDGDHIVLAGDDNLHEAVGLARAANAPALKLVASRRSNKGGENPVPTPLLVGIGVGVVAGISLLSVLLTRGRRR